MALRDFFTGHDQITHLVASPLRRTLSTCLLAFAPVIASSSSSPDKDPAVIIPLPDAQELSLYDCDRGTDVAVLKDEYNGQREVVDFTLVPDDWSVKFHPDRHPNVDNLVVRARRVRLWLRDLAARAGGEDVQVVLVTHGGFLHFLTEDWDGIPPRKGTCLCLSRSLFLPWWLQAGTTALTFIAI